MNTILSKVLNLQEEKRRNIKVKEDPTLRQIEEELISYAKANPYSDTFVATFARNNEFIKSRDAIVKYFTDEGFKVFTTVTNGHFQIVLKWNII